MCETAYSSAAYSANLPFSSVKKSILLWLSLTWSLEEERPREGQQDVAGLGYVSLSVFLMVRPPVPTTTVLPSACSNINLFACLVRTVFFSRGSVVKTCVAFDSVWFCHVCFQCKGSFKYSRWFLGKQSILPCEWSWSLASCFVY